MAKGYKTGGRGKSTPNKRTVEKLKEVEAQVAAVRTLRQKKATEVLNELMQTSMGLAARFQRRIMADPAPNDLARFDADLDRFWRAMDSAGVFAKSLAPFQDPTFKALMVSVAPDAAPVKQIEGNVHQLNDPVALARVYSNMIRQVG